MQRRQQLLLGLSLVLLAVTQTTAQTIFHGNSRDQAFTSDDLPPVVRAEYVADEELFVSGRLDDADGVATVVEFSDTPSLTMPNVTSVPCVPPSVLEPTFWQFELEYLHWQPHQRGLDFAVAEDGTAITVGHGQIQNLELDRDNGFRSAIRYQTKTGWSFGGRYTYFDSDGTATVERPPGVGELFATRSHPDTNEEAEIATATGALDYRVFELNFGRSILCNRFSDIRVFGGLRYSELSQRLRLDYDGRDFVDGVVTTATDIDGFGMQVGAEGYWRMARGFGLFGRVATGVTLGDFDTMLFESNLDGAQIVTDVEDHFNQSVPLLEIRTGVCWQCRGFEVAAGYEFTNWFNVGNRSQLIDDIHEGLYGPFSSDILLSGMFGRASFRY